MMRDPHPPLRLASTLAVIALLACGESDEQDGPGAEQAAIPVEVVEVQERTLAETVRGVGSLRAALTVEIQPEIDAILEEIHFEEGGRVEAGQLLYRLDDEQLLQEVSGRQSALAAARARLKNARQVFERTERLFQRGVASRNQYDQARTSLDEAEAQIEELESQLAVARRQLENTRIRAPFSGAISESRYDPGDYVRQGEPLATLYRTSPLEIRFTLPERFMGRIEQGQPVEITVAAFPNQGFEGELTYVSPAIQETTRDFEIKAEIENPEALLKPGAFATAEVTVEVRESQPVLPEDALVATREGYMVFVVNEEGVAERRDVQIGLRQAGWVEVRAGIEAGERVVRSGQMNLAEGSPVEMVSPFKVDGDRR